MLGWQYASRRGGMESETQLEIDRALALLQAGNSMEAEAMAMRIVATDSGSARAWFIVGAARHRQLRPESALLAMERALVLDPEMDGARQACVTLLLGLKRPRAALALNEEIARRHPEDISIVVDAGVVLEELGDWAAALARYDEALRRNSRDFRARLNRGALLARVGRFDDALQNNRALVRGYVGSADAHYNLADVLLQMDRYAEALVAADRALRLAPTQARTYMLRGLVLAMLARDAEAVASFNRAYSVDAEGARSFRASAAAAVGLDDEERLTEDPRQIRLARLLERQRNCDWAERERLIAGMRELVADLRESPEPLKEMGLYHSALSLPLTPYDQQALAQGIAAEVGAHAGNDFPRLRVVKPAAEGKIRLGFISPNFREHPSAQLHWRHFALRDRGRFEVYAYSLHHSDGVLRQRIIESSDAFREVSGLDSKEIAARIALDGIDMLVDLAGHKDFSRPEVLALRPAPLRVSYLGLPGTMGAELIDYRITDALTTPPEERNFWSERLVVLPDTLWIYNNLEAVAGNAPSRLECGLPEYGFVFCNFNAHYKIEPDVFDVWMRLLGSLPNSVLWLLDNNDEARHNLRSEAAVRGVTPERLVFAPHLPREEHLARHACADLFLDTFYYCAHTTAADSLWAGLPVLTCPGETMASRIGASIVCAAGLPELAVPDRAAYVATALRLARQPRELAALRARLVRQRQACTLFATEQRVRELDLAFEMMWQRHLAGLLPESFVVPRNVGTSP